MAKDGANGRWRIRRREDAVETALERTQKTRQTQGSTQVQGPREEVKPLLLLVWTIMDEHENYNECSSSCMKLSELYSLSLFFL
jgi:hypothetical protein